MGKFNFIIGDFKNKELAPDHPELTGYETIQPDPEKSDSLSEELKTLLEFSREIGVSKQKVYRCIKSNNMPVKIVDDKIYIDDAVQSLVISELNKNNDAVNNHIRSVSRYTLNTGSKHVSKSTSKITAKQFMYMINIMEKQLNEKDRQIAELIKIIDNLKKGSV